MRITPARMRIWMGGILLVFLSLVWAGLGRRTAPAYPNLAVHTEGVFMRNGEWPRTSVEQFPDASRVRRWASWNGSDANTGEIRMGPFPAPDVLRFWSPGNPPHKGLDLHVERADTHERHPVGEGAYVGERWKLISEELPAAWRGKPVLLVARDDARDDHGWIGVSEPVCFVERTQLVAALTTFSINGLVLGVLWFFAARRLTVHSPLPAAWTPFLATAAVATLGYIAFWAFFAGPLCGRIFTVGIFLVAFAELFWKPPGSGDLSPETIAVSKMAVLIGCFYLGLLNLFPSVLDYYSLAAGRWLQMPGDNVLPHNVARELFDGASLKWPHDGWLSSDRPPLQSGWMLLAWPFTAIFDLDARTAGGTAALWLQLSWVFGAYGLLRAFGIARGRACAWTSILSLCGFFLVNSVYTWPKLASGAFACGAFGCWILRKRREPDRGAIAVGGGLAGLAWLSHEGVTYAFIALVPWILCRLKGQPRRWVGAFLLFLALALPWMAYQRFYDPPGNRNAKWYLGGQIEIDPRGTWQTIREAYASSSWEQLVGARITNLKLQIFGDWNPANAFSAAHLHERRSAEFSILLHAVTWLLAGVIALPFALKRRGLQVEWAAHRDAALWLVATFVVWCLMLFLPYTAVIHLGSYTQPLLFFVLLCSWLELACGWAAIPIAILQLASFATTYVVAGDSVGGDPDLPAIAVAAVALLALLVVVIREQSPQVGDAEFGGPKSARG